jgi:predicted ATPase
MLKKLRIQNFKGWKDTGDISLAPLTLFFGTNSSGKSSIGQFLMMLKQTVESPDRKSPLYIGTKNAAVNLGSYFDILYNRDKSKVLKFCYEWDLNKTLTITDKDENKSFIVETILFDSELKLTSKQPSTLYVEKMLYQLFVSNVDESETDSITLSMKRISEENDHYRTTSDGYRLKKNVGRAWSPGHPIKYYGFPDEVVGYHRNAAFVRDITFENEKLFRQVYYLGPLRMSAERTYPWTGTSPDSVGYSGENTISAILAAKDRKLNFGKGKKRYSFQEIIAIKLKEMGLIKEFKLEQVVGSRHEYKLKIKTKGSKSYVDLPDVGFGLSQVLPVITQLFYAPANSIIIMEQPEIHLHPSAQSILADVMIDALNSTENGKERNIQLIIETHSEHFLRRLQRRIAENSSESKVIDKSAVEAYFCDFGKDGAKMTALEVDEYGSIINWPENFFGDEMEDIVAQSKAAILKRRQDLM